MSTTSSPFDRDNESPGETRGGFIKRASLVLWVGVIAFAVGDAIAQPSTINIFVAAAFVALCLAVNAQLFLVRWMGKRSWNRVISRMHRSSYLSEVHNLPNRNYLLAELRREMP